MRLVYLNTKENRYFWRDCASSVLEFRQKIGECNKIGQRLLYVIYEHKGKLYILNSWDDVLIITEEPKIKQLFDRCNLKVEKFKKKLSHKLIRLAYLIYKK